MKSRSAPIYSLIILFATLASAALHASTTADSWCSKGDGTACSSSELSNPDSFRQIVVMPAGFDDGDRDRFQADFNALIQRNKNSGGSPFTITHGQDILYIGKWIAGGELSSSDTNFGAAILEHPVRGTALSLKRDDVIDAIERFQAADHNLSPLGVVVIFNSDDDDVTANAIPPTFTEKEYGIAKITRGHLRTSYAGMHEIAHATLNFLDEYIEGGFEDMNIRSLDALTPLAQLDGSWGGWVRSIENALGMYNFSISEVLAANGSDNIDLRKNTSLVTTSGYSPNPYEYEGGMFFGRGTYHDRGSNIMNSDRVKRGSDDGFAYAHSSSQRGVIDQAFGDIDSAARPNDRIRNAGPLKNWNLSFGSTTKVMLFDADKNHRFHPTDHYDVQVSWDERVWRTCSKWGIPYPCYRTERKTAERITYPSDRHIDLKTSALNGLANLVQNVSCSIGIDEIGPEGERIDICSMSVAEMSDAFLPALKFPLPYQEVSVPASQRLTTYRWRFRTNNGTWTSGWTGWAEFKRVL